MRCSPSIILEPRGDDVQRKDPGNSLREIGFVPLEVKDRFLFDRLLHPIETMLSAYSFVTHYVWSDLYRFYKGFIDDYLCLFAQYDEYIYMPLPPVPCRGLSPEVPENRILIPPVYSGICHQPESPKRRGGRYDRYSESFQGIVTTVFSIMDRINKNKAASRIENIDEVHAEAFISMGYEIRPGEGEYVYLRKDLVELKGNAYKSKRALCNYFERHYPYRYEPFQPGDIDECLRLFGEWRRKREEKINDTFYRALMEDSFSAHEQAMRYHRELRLEGRVVRIEGRIEGYIFGFARGDILYILMEVTNLDIKGLAQFIFREFCKEIDSYTYVNVLGDGGLENLRAVKGSYRPYRIVPAYIASPPSSHYTKEGR